MRVLLKTLHFGPFRRPSRFIFKTKHHALRWEIWDQPPAQLSSNPLTNMFPNSIKANVLIMSWLLKTGVEGDQHASLSESASLSSGIDHVGLPLPAPRLAMSRKRSQEIFDLPGHARRLNGWRLPRAYCNVSVPPAKPTTVALSGKTPRKDVVLSLRA